MSAQIEFEDLVECLNGYAKQSVVINEASFGNSFIAPYLDNLPENADILEVGSGACLLLAHLQTKYKDFNFTGIEPLGPGFQTFEQSIHNLQDLTKFNLYRGGYESFQPEKKFDFIFSVNVFEHLADWRDFLDFLAKNLSNTGKSVVLCPNYGFPYESHFALPIIINKTLTKKIFNKYIQNFEHENDCDGLWQSLNMVTWGQIKSQIQHSPLNMNTRNNILSEMIKRLHTDKEFAKRQGKMGGIAKALSAIGLVTLLEQPLFSRIMPYMQLEFSKKNVDIPNRHC